LTSPSSNGKARPTGTRKRSAASSGTAKRQATAVVRALKKADLTELYRFWSGESAPALPKTDKEVREHVLSWMGDAELLMERVEQLGRRLGTILDLHLHAQRYECTRHDLGNAKEIAYLSNYDLEASLTVLARRGLLATGRSNGMVENGARCTAVPTDIGDTILRQRRAKRRGIFDTFTLRGHLDRLYDDPARAARTSPSRVREMYKMYSNEAASVARIERLPEGLRDLVQKVVLEFGGLLPRKLFDRMDTELPHWNGRRWGKILEESLVGTVERLELGRYGIQHDDETLITFNEVTLAWFRRVAVPGDPDEPHDEASLGVDLVSNISRFLAFIIDHNVRFTVRGEIFKTTEKRILQDLIPNPGRELDRSDVLNFIYAFTRHAGLIESTGERTFALTTDGRDWEQQGYDQKLQALFDYVLEERDLGGEYYHQVRMRRLFLRLIKRIEPGVWYDIMYLPFLARNGYLCSLDELAVDEHFASRTQVGQYTAMDDLQRMAWNLVGWLRKRLYLLGLVDLGYDKAGHPVAMRLTRIGARLLGLEGRGESQAIGSLVVTPDFEVVMFPTGDDAELNHDLDRFCDRQTLGQVMHFQITDRSVHRALSEGMSLKRIFTTLEDNARTPVPQNVLYSIRDWAVQAGLLFLDSTMRVTCPNPDLLARFSQDPGVRQYLKSVDGENSVQLENGITPARMRSLLRDLQFLVELE